MILIEKFLKYSFKTCCLAWFATSFVILFFLFSSMLAVITQKAELQALLWLSLLFFAPLITIAIPLTFLALIISVVIYVSKFGTYQSFKELKIYILKIKNKFLSPKKDFAKFILFIISSIPLIVCISFVSYVYIDWILKDWIYRTLYNFHINF